MPPSPVARRPRFEIRREMVERPSGAHGAAGAVVRRRAWHVVEVETSRVLRTYDREIDAKRAAIAWELGR
jgi:hypothetical protein